MNRYALLLEQTENEDYKCFNKIQFRFEASDPHTATEFGHALAGIMNGRKYEREPDWEATVEETSD